MPPINKILLWLGVAAGSILSFVFVIYLAMMLFPSGAKKTIDNQLAAIRAEDAVLAYSYTTRAFQDSTSLDTFRKFINAYSGLRNNKSISYQSRENTNGITLVKATLLSRNGSETPVRYQLIKENGQWKIQGMIINPAQDTQDKNARETEEKSTSVATPAPTPQTDTAKPQAVVLSNYYQDPRYGFSVRYPAGWQYSIPGRGVVNFRGQPGTPSNISAITIQTTKITHRRSVQQVIDDVRTTIARRTSQMQLIDDGNIPSLQSGSVGMQARYNVYSYTMNNQKLALLFVVFYKNPDRALYLFDFTTTAEQFEADVPIAKSMVDSLFGN